MLSWSILQYIWPALSHNRSWKPSFGLFEWQLKTDLLYCFQFYLTLCILMNSSIWFGTMGLGWLIVYIKGSQFRTSKLRCIILALSANPDEMPQNAAFIWVFTVCHSIHLGVSSTLRVNPNQFSRSLKVHVQLSIGSSRLVFVWTSSICLCGTIRNITSTLHLYG